MPQSSLTAWLQKPVIIPQKSNASVTPESASGSAVENTKGEVLVSKTTRDDAPLRDASAKDTATEQPPVVLAKQSWTAPSPQLPPNVEIRSCTKADIPAFKRLNSVLLPLPYLESFYNAIINDTVTGNLTLLAVWHDDPANVGKEKGRLVGAIRCRLLPDFPSGPSGKDEGEKKTMLYLSTLALLSPYRGHGIAAHMLHTLTVRAVDAYGITSIGAHVWEANEEGLEWYVKRGFKVVGKEEGYYRKLDPSGAVIVQRGVKVTDLLGR